MRRLFVAILLMAFVPNATAQHRYYIYRVSPANAPLKIEEAIYAPRPEYPLIARQKHLTGRGLFVIHIRPDGKVKGVTIIKSTGHAELDQAAIKSFQGWRFRPHSVRQLRVPIGYVIGPRPKHIVPHFPMKNYGDGADITIGFGPL